MLELVQKNVSLETQIQISQSLTDPVFNNEVDPVQHDIKLKAIEDAIGDARKKIKPKVIEAATGIKSELGVAITLRKGSQTLDYSQDPEWKILNERQKARESLLKQAWELRQKDPDSQLCVGGEEIPVVPVKSYTADSISYTFGK